MKKFALSALALVFVMSAAAGAMAQTIDDIQAYDPVTGLPASPYAGTIQTVEGVVYVVNNVYNNGTHYIIDDSGNGIQFYYPNAPVVNYGDRIQVTGTIPTSPYGGENQLSTPSIALISSGAEPTPVAMTVDEVLNGVGGEDGYENVGKFVDVAGIVTSVGSSNFYLANTGFTDTIQVYIDSTTGINIGAVAAGDAYRVITPVVVYNGEIELKPRKQGDLIEGTGPVIDAINCDDWSPLATESIVVSAEIVDDVSVTSATLYYRDSDGSGTGAFGTVAMSNVGGDTYSGVIPAGTLGRQVDFYIEASDGSSVSANPGDAPVSWYEVAVGMTPIYDVQYVHPDSLFTGSNLAGMVVNVSGIVTVGTGDAGLSQSQFVVQDADGAWNGLFVYEGSAGNFLLAGDEVEIGGYVTEYYGLTEINPHKASAVELISFENALPTAVQVNTAVLSDDLTSDSDGTPAYGEAYESVWVKTFNSTVIDTTGSAAYSTFEVSDSGAQADSLIVDAGFDMVYEPVIGDMVTVTGFMTYDYGNFELIPVADEGIVVGGTAAPDQLPHVEAAGGFSGIAPNPFNPQTEIRFVLTRDNMTQLNVYNLRGELVNTLVNGRLVGGQEHVVTWDGRDTAGQQVASGTYFARLRIGTEVLQVRKLMLVK